MNSTREPLARTLRGISNANFPLESAMKYLLAVAAMIGCASLNGAHAGNSKPPPDNSVVEKIRSLEEERNKAIVDGDAAALDRMTSDDYTLIQK